MYPQSMFKSKNKKIIIFFLYFFFIFTAVNNDCILHGHVFLMGSLSVDQMTHEKICPPGFRPGPTLTELYNHRRLEA